jgi:hypothetical protein
MRARDKAGNVSAYTTAYTWYPSLVQQSATSVTYGGTWSSISSASSSGGSVKYALVAGASASMTFSGRAVAWVTTLRPTSGVARVYIDGLLAATIDTTSATTVYRQVVYSRAWSSYTTHTIKIVVVGTAGRPRVDLDAFELIR